MQTIHEKPDDLQPVSDVFQHSTLRGIVQKARYLLALEHEIQKLVPSGFGSYCRVMNVKEQTLIVGISNAAIATRIQMISDDIVQVLQKNPAFTAIRAIKCKVYLL